jgi:AcrR family transcriptional regulator
VSASVDEKRFRLPAAERRAAIVNAALRVFGERSYGRATTAEIARAAGVTEPVLYRHFASKGDLYVACLEEMSTRLRETAEEIIAAERDPREWPFAIPRAIDQLRKNAIYPSQMWIQALGEVGEDPELARYLRQHMRRLHAFVADIIRRAQRAGGVASDREPEAEAWIGLGLGLLRAVQARLGGVLTAADFDAITRSRRLSLRPPADGDASDRRPAASS